MVLDEINGGYITEYGLLYNYTKELEISNPRTTTDVKVDDNKPEKIPYFSKFYIYFNACK